MEAAQLKVLRKGQRPGAILRLAKLRTWATASCCLFFLNSPRASLYGASVTELHFLIFVRLGPL